MASSEILQMVGIDINANMSPALKTFNPVAILNVFCKNGATMKVYDILNLVKEAV